MECQYIVYIFYYTYYQTKMPSNKQIVGAYARGRSIDELERARNINVTIYPCFMSSPGTVKGSQRGRGKGRIPNFSHSKLPNTEAIITLA